MIELETQSKLLSQTPRSDAFLKALSATSSIWREAPMAMANVGDFARQLERENAVLREALLELAEAVERKADIGSRRAKTVSPRMEVALATARAALKPHSP